MSTDAPRLLALGLGVFALMACSKQVKIDAETVDERLDHLEADIPSCTTSDGASSARLAGEAVEQGLRRFGDAVVALRQLRKDGQTTAGFTSSSTCGGSMDVDYEHAHGDTDYTAVFTDYCVPGESGEQVVYNGTFQVFEKGTPSDKGPIIKKVEMKTEGPVTVTQGSQSFEVEAKDIQTAYGNPSEWEPAFPDSTNPDVTTIGEIRVTFPDGRIDFVDSVILERTSGLPAEVHVRSATTGTKGEGVSHVHTPDDAPLMVDIYDGTVYTGTLIFDGKGKSAATLTRDVNTADTWTVTIDGETYERDIDCAEGLTARASTLDAVFQALPIY